MRDTRFCLASLVPCVVRLWRGNWPSRGSTKKFKISSRAQDRSSCHWLPTAAGRRLFLPMVALVVACSLRERPLKRSWGSAPRAAIDPLPCTARLPAEPTWRGIRKDRRHYCGRIRHVPRFPASRDGRLIQPANGACANGYSHTRIQHPILAPDAHVRFGVITCIRGSRGRRPRRSADGVDPPPPVPPRTSSTR